MKSDPSHETLNMGRYVILRTLARRDEEFHNDPGQYLEMMRKRLFGEDARLEQTLGRIVDRYINRTSLPDRIGVLDAHGYQGEPGQGDSGRWCYRLNGGGDLVQSWISEMDGTFGALYVHACNPGGANIQSRKSLVIHPQMNLGRTVQEANGMQIDWYIPGFGYINPADFRLEKFLNGATIREAKSDRRSLF